MKLGQKLVTSANPDILTKSEYARRRGMSPSYIGDLVKAGKLPKRSDGLLDVNQCDPIMDALSKAGPAHLRAVHERRKQESINRALAKAPSTPSDDIDDLLALPEPAPSAKVLPFERPKREDPGDFTPKDPYSKARLATEQFRAKQAEADYRRTVGELIERAATEAAVSDCANLTRAIVERLPDRAGERLAAVLKVDPSTIVTLLQAEVAKTCAEISTAAQALADKVQARKGGDDAPF